MNHRPVKLALTLSCTENYEILQNAIQKVICVNFKNYIVNSVNVLSTPNTGTNTAPHETTQWSTAGITDFSEA